jgi:hypothetical protein
MRFLGGAEGEGFRTLAGRNRPERLSRPQAFGSTMRAEVGCATQRATVRFVDAKFIGLKGSTRGPMRGSWSVASRACNIVGGYECAAASATTAATATARLQGQVRPTNSVRLAAARPGRRSRPHAKRSLAGNARAAWAGSFRSTMRLSLPCGGAGCCVRVVPVWSQTRPLRPLAAPPGLRSSRGAGWRYSTAGAAAFSSPPAPVPTPGLPLAGAANSEPYSREMSFRPEPV